MPKYLMDAKICYFMKKFSVLIFKVTFLLHVVLENYDVYLDFITFLSKGSIVKTF